MKNQLIVVLELIIHVSLYAGNDHYPAGARSSSLATASVSLCDIWSSFSNQAGLAWLSRPSAGFHYENRFLVNRYALQAGALAIPFPSGTLGVDYLYFGYSAYHEMKAGLAYARKLHQNVAAGVQLNYHQTYIAEGLGTSRALTVELGLMYTPVEGLFIGFHAFNPNRSRTFPEEYIPAVLRAGVGYNILQKASVLFETEKDLDKSPVFKGGIEISALKKLDFRFGFGTGYIEYTFGLGYHFSRYHFDLAFSHHDILGFTPHVSFTFKPGKHHE